MSAKNLYTKQPNLIFGFHGTSKDKINYEELILSKDKHLKPSKKDYDWLGSGIYFWQNDPQRAMDWAIDHYGEENAVVVGAVIDLGECLDFCEQTAISLMNMAYELVLDEASVNKLELKNSKSDPGGFKLVRKLDCAVIERLHAELDKNNQSFDTVKGYFQEDEPIFEGSGIRKKSHIQICVRHTECIKAYFVPREK